MYTGSQWSTSLEDMSITQAAISPHYASNTEGFATSLNRVRDFEIPRFHRISRFREITKISRFQEISRISWDFACLQDGLKTEITAPLKETLKNHMIDYVNKYKIYGVQDFKISSIAYNLAAQTAFFFYIGAGKKVWSTDYYYYCYY